MEHDRDDDTTQSVKDNSSELSMDTLKALRAEVQAAIEQYEKLTGNTDIATNELSNTGIALVEDLQNKMKPYLPFITKDIESFNPKPTVPFLTSLAHSLRLIAELEEKNYDISFDTDVDYESSLKLLIQSWLLTTQAYRRVVALSISNNNTEEYLSAHNLLALACKNHAISLGRLARLYENTEHLEEKEYKVLGQQLKVYENQTKVLEKLALLYRKQNDQDREVRIFELQGVAYGNQADVVYSRATCDYCKNDTTSRRHAFITQALIRKRQADVLLWLLNIYDIRKDLKNGRRVNRILINVYFAQAEAFGNAGKRLKQAYCYDHALVRCYSYIHPNALRRAREAMRAVLESLAMHYENAANDPSKKSDLLYRAKMYLKQAKLLQMLIDKIWYCTTDKRIKIVRMKLNDALDNEHRMRKGLKGSERDDSILTTEILSRGNDQKDTIVIEMEEEIVNINIHPTTTNKISSLPPSKISEKYWIMLGSNKMNYNSVKATNAREYQFSCVA